MPSHPDREKYAYLDVKTMRIVADLLEKIQGVEESTDFYLGQTAVMHTDGWRIGFLVPYEDWWVFVPDYAEDPHE